MAITATAARQTFYNLLDDVNENSAPILIQRRNNKNAVLLSESDWNAIQETLHLMSVPGMAASIKEGMETPLDECVPESDVAW
ncbi:MAG: type II toxin-antitoxin system Phd/YefM family antitoxin [Synergistaceae bacterium]|nr:type II toxin-antitoxin system Phd/YefM family antitoxin [Synergistaceae bacterium]